MKRKIKMISEKKLLAVMGMFPGKTRSQVELIVHRDLSKRLKPALFISGILLVLAIWGFGTEKPEEILIERPTRGNQSVRQELLLEGEDGWQKVVLEVGALEYEEEEIERLHVQLSKQLDELVLGENKSFSEVLLPLCFPVEEDGFSLQWSSDTPWLLDCEGKVHNRELKEKTLVTIAAKIYYGSEFRVYERQVTVVPPTYTKEEQMRMEAEQWLSELEQKSRTEPVFVLPQTVLGRRLEKQGENNAAGLLLVLLSAAFPLLLYQSYFSRQSEERKKREKQAKRVYPEFVTRLSLLLAAGVTGRQAFGRLSQEYEKRYGKNHVLAGELKITRQELENGYSEQEAYEAFGKRMGILAYQRLASLLAQSVTKGVQSMREQLLSEAREVMAAERAEIRVRGEQAGTKMMLPMMGFLILVFAILLVPAFQMF